METDPHSPAHSRICPSRKILESISDKWTALVMGILAEAEGPVRFREFRLRIDGISQKMLTQTLRDLERDGLVVRTAYPVIPPRVEYSLTPLGQTLQVPLAALSAWAVEHMAEIEKAQTTFDRVHQKPSGDARLLSPLAR